MDAVKFIIEWRRVCDLYWTCADCPLGGDEPQACRSHIQYDPEEAIAIIEDWAKRHPSKTNAQKFEEVFGVPVKNKVCLFLECDENGGGFVDGELQGCDKCKLNNWWSRPYEGE